MVSIRYFKPMASADDPAVVADLLERIGRLLQNELYAGGLPPAQWQVLLFLANANRFSRTPGAVGLYLGATKGTVSQTVMALARKGLVSKRQDRADRRSVSLRLTARGEALLARHPLTEILQAISGLPCGTRAALGEGLARLLAVILARRGGRMFGQCAHCRFFRAGSVQEASRCGLLNVELSDDDAAKICVEYEPAA
jgi:DNA-binding MarR family transcriptional regulator